MTEAPTKSPALPEGAPRENPLKAVEKEIRTLISRCATLQKEKTAESEATLQGLRKTLLEFIEVVDNFENLFREFEALAEPPHESTKAWVNNFRMVYKIHLRALKRSGVVEMQIGPEEKVDPAKHNTTETESATGKPDETILAVLKKGYLLHDQILRVAEVRAAKNS